MNTQERRATQEAKDVFTFIENAPKGAQTADRTAIMPFEYKQRPVRVIPIEGLPWFVAKDVCDILEYASYRSALQKLDDDEKGVEKFDTPGGMQEMSIVNESGLYTLILRSNKPEAKPFRKWVTSEVLPQVIRTGKYEKTQIDLSIGDAKGDKLLSYIYGDHEQVLKDEQEKSRIYRELAEERAAHNRTLQEYNALLKAGIGGVEKPIEKPVTYRHLSADEKRRIRDMHKQGYSNYQIAHELGRSESAVRRIVMKQYVSWVAYPNTPKQ